ncbi:MAG TPA: threonine synthase [Ignavibacteriaceae bacterium]|nr:threonine synthase [Ignavibacteriaceae bacterium]
MNFYSTKNKNISVSLKEAVLKGIPEDGGLFMPERIPAAGKDFLKRISSLNFNEIAFELSRLFFSPDLSDEDLKNLIDKTYTFSSPLIRLDQNLFVLELFHGPTMAFKDFGARFTASLISFFVKDETKDITILVATSGDTGSAVASAFYKMPGIKIVLLYPSGKISKMQEKQITTYGGNVTALEVDGTFDDCQSLVKSAFADIDLNKKMMLSSSNSINIARLLPQAFYYFSAYAQLKDKNKSLIFSVPSGNFGNLTAGLIAYKMGLPVYKFAAAVNANDIFPSFLRSGKFIPQPSVKTLSNAMDVGNPSNFFRIIDLLGNDHKLVGKVIFSESFSDKLTVDAIKEIKAKFNYIMDPHGAVGYLALKKFTNEIKINNYNGMILETAHPAKFIDTVKTAVGGEIEMPEVLKACLKKKKLAEKISNNFSDFKEYLLNRD